MKELLRRHFGRRTIGRGLANHWPSRSPDINVCDYFLWSFLKDIVFTEPGIHTREDLEARITAAFDVVRESKMQQLGSAVAQWRKRLQLCDEKNGTNVDPLLR